LGNTKIFNLFVIDYIENTEFDQTVFLYSKLHTFILINLLESLISTVVPIELLKYFPK